MRLGASGCIEVELPFDAVTQAQLRAVRPRGQCSGAVCGRSIMSIDTVVRWAHCNSRHLVNVRLHPNGSSALCSFTDGASTFDIHLVEWFTELSVFDFPEHIPFRMCERCPADASCFRNADRSHHILTSASHYRRSFSSETYFLGMFLPKQFSFQVKSSRLTSSFFNFQDRSGRLSNFVKYTLALPF